MDRATVTELQHADGDAVDVSAVRAFWASILGYQDDPRTFLTDIYDPRRLNPVLFFQPMDASDTERRHVAAAWRIITENASDRRTLVDPEGNEVDIVTFDQA